MGYLWFCFFFHGIGMGDLCCRVPVGLPRPTSLVWAWFSSSCSACPQAVWLATKLWRLRMLAGKLPFQAPNSIDLAQEYWSMEPLPPWNEVPYVAPQCKEARMWHPATNESSKEDKRSVEIWMVFLWEKDGKSRTFNRTSFWASLGHFVATPGVWRHAANWEPSKCRGVKRWGRVVTRHSGSLVVVE